MWWHNLLPMSCQEFPHKLLGEGGHGLGAQWIKRHRGMKAPICAKTNLFQARLLRHPAYMAGFLAMTIGEAAGAQASIGPKGSLQRRSDTSLRGSEGRRPEARRPEERRRRRRLESVTLADPNDRGNLNHLTSEKMGKLQHCDIP